MKASRFLRFEPLESRLQFAVDYAIWEPDLFSLPASEFLASTEPVSAWSVYEFGAAAVPELSTLLESDSAQQFGFSTALTPLFIDSLSPLESLSPPEIDYWEDMTMGNRDDYGLSGEAWLLGGDEYPLALDALTPHMDLVEGLLLTDQSYLLKDLEQPLRQTTQHVFELGDFDWIAVTVPFQVQSASFGSSSEAWIGPTSLLRFGPASDVLPTTAEVFSTVALDVNQLSFIINETLSWLSQTQLSGNHGDTSASIDQFVMELSELNFRNSPPDLHSREMVGKNDVDSGHGFFRDSRNIYYSANLLDSQPSLELELEDQLPVEKSTHANARTLRSRVSVNVVDVNPGCTSSKSTNAVAAMNMLPLGMLPIGNEPVNSPASSSRDYAAGNQHFIVQTALICESADTLVVRHEKGHEKCHEEGVEAGRDGEPMRSKEFALASPNRSMGIVAAGFVLFVIQARLRLPSPLRTYWEKRIGQFKRSEDAR